MAVSGPSESGRPPSAYIGTTYLQVALWQRAYVMVTPHGAHVSNVVYMRAGTGGLIESFNCGHTSDTYKRIAQVATWTRKML